MTCYETSEKFRRQQYKTIKSKEEQILEKASFPNCKGLYPDCPENPSQSNDICKNCPILDD